MTIIGDLWVSVRPDTTGFNTDLESRLNKAIGTSGSGLTNAASKVGAGVVAGLAVAGIASIKLASDFQASVADIQANSDISTAAAKRIGEAFQSTAGKSIFSATQLAESFSTVAGPLKQLEGRALTAKQALDFMSTASDLAEASGESLGSATKTLQGVMTAFQVPVKDAANASNILFNTSKVTGVGLDQLGSTVNRLKARLGVAAPSLASMGTLLVDLQSHGVSGSRGLLVINTAMTTLLKSADTVGPAVAKTVESASKAAAASSTALASAQERLSEAQAKLSGTGGPTLAQTQALAKAQQDVAQAQQNVLTSTGASAGPANALANAQLRLQDIQQKMAAGSPLSISQQQTLANAQQAVATATAKHSAATAALTAAQNGLSPSLSATVAGAEQLGLKVFDAQGKFVGMGNVIAQLQPKLKGLTEQQKLQALSTVLGTTANKALLATVEGGSAAWDKASAAVTKANDVHRKAEIQGKTLAHQMDLVRASLTDVGVKVGQVLIPKLEDLGKIVVAVIGFFEKHKAIAEALAITIGTVLTAAVVVFAINMGTKLVGSVEKAAKSIGLFGGTSKETKPAVSSLNDILIALEGTLERLSDQLPTIDTQLGETGAAFDELAATVEGGEEAMATTAEVAGPAIEAGLGPIGLAIGAIAILLPLLLDHWKAVWGAIMVAVHVVVAAIKADLHYIEEAFDDVIHFIESHWKLIVGILLAPILPVVAAWLIFPKQIKKIIDDVVGFFVKLPGRIVGAFSAAGSFLEKIGKDIVGGLIKGLEFTSPVFWVLHFKSQILGFFADVGKWLLHAGEDLVAGMIKGAVEAPLKGLEKLGHSVIGGIKSVLHIFSPSKDTEPLGGFLVDGLVGGVVKAAADTSKITKPFDNLNKAVLAKLTAMGDQVFLCGINIMMMLAKGIEAGSNAVAVAFNKVGVKVSAAGTAGASVAGGGGGAALDVAKQELDFVRMMDARLAQISTCCQQQETIASFGIANARTDANQMIALTRSTQQALSILMARDFAVMTAALVNIGGDVRQSDSNLTERGNIETAMLVQQLSVDRLHLLEAKTQTELLRELLQQAKTPQTLKIQPAPGSAAPAAPAATSASALASAILS